MEVQIAATIEGRHYAYARTIERDLLHSPHALDWEIRMGIVRGRRFNVGGGRERILVDLEDAKIIHDLVGMLRERGVAQDHRAWVMDFFAIRAGFASWHQAWSRFDYDGNPHAA